MTAARSPWQNAYAERLIGSLRRECLDHVIVLDELHLLRILAHYFEYYNRKRCHLSPSRRCSGAPGRAGAGSATWSRSRKSVDSTIDTSERRHDDRTGVAAGISVRADGVFGNDTSTASPSRSAGPCLICAKKSPAPTLFEMKRPTRFFCFADMPALRVAESVTRTPLSARLASRHARKTTVSCTLLG